MLHICLSPQTKFQKWAVIVLFRCLDCIKHLCLLFHYYSINGSGNGINTFFVANQCHVILFWPEALNQLLHKLLTFYNIFGVFMMPIMLVYQYFLIKRILATNMLGPSSLMNWVKQYRGSMLWVKSSCRRYKWTICIMQVVNFSIKSPVVLNHFFKIHLLNGQITLPFAWKSPFWIHINTFLTSLETSKAIN